MDGDVAIGGQGEGGQNPLQVQLAEAGAGAVAVAQQVIEPVAIQLAAHQGLDGGFRVLAVFEQVGHGLGGAGGVGLEAIAQGGMLAHQSRRPNLMAQAIHLLAGMAQGPVAHVMEQGSGQQHAAVLLQGGLEGHQAIKGLAGQV